MMKLKVIKIISSQNVCGS